MSPNQDNHKEENPSAGDYPETQTPSERSSIDSTAPTQGSCVPPPTPPSPVESATDDHLDLTALATEPAVDAVQDWDLEERPDPVDAVPVMNARLALMMARYEGLGAVEGAPANDADTKADPTPPSDG